MAMVEMNTIDPLIGLQSERDYLNDRVKALEQIIIDQTCFDWDAELIKFMRCASRKYDKQLAEGWDADARRFRNSNLQKRWAGWLDKARDSEVKR